MDRDSGYILPTSIFRRERYLLYRLALPLDSYGSMMTTIAASTNNPPETYTGTGVPKSPNIATIGATHQLRSTR
jgi:hypothetical protein